MDSLLKFMGKVVGYTMGGIVAVILSTFVPTYLSDSLTQKPKFREQAIAQIRRGIDEDNNQVYSEAEYLKFFQKQDIPCDIQHPIRLEDFSTKQIRKGLVDLTALDLDTIDARDLRDLNKDGTPDIKVDENGKEKIYFGAWNEKNWYNESEGRLRFVSREIQKILEEYPLFVK